MVSRRYLMLNIRRLRLAIIILVAGLITSCSPRINPNNNDNPAVLKPNLEGASSTERDQEMLDLDSASLSDEDQGSLSTVGDSANNQQGTTADSSLSSSAQSLAPGEWKELPVIPEISENAKEIYLRGIEAGNDPAVFAKVGDCQNVPSMFLSIFDYPGFYSLGEEYGYLQETIDWYHGSFSRESEAVRRGFNAASVVSPVWADPEACEQGETPLECEIRINNPSVALISLETWWEGNPENYEKYVRQIIEGLLDENILPVIATKADNLEGDHQINEILVRLAMEYQIPVWNYWRAVQPLPGNGLMEDRFHLTFDDNHFDDPDAMMAAWPWRNLTALQVLDKIRTGLGPQK